jgi:hypothetical protein
MDYDSVSHFVSQPAPAKRPPPPKAITTPKLPTLPPKAKPRTPPPATKAIKPPKSPPALKAAHPPTPSPPKPRPPLSKNAQSIPTSSNTRAKKGGAGSTLAGASRKSKSGPDTGSNKAGHKSNPASISSRLAKNQSLPKNTAQKEATTSHTGVKKGGLGSTLAGGSGKSISASANKAGSKVNPPSGVSCPFTKGQHKSIYRRSRCCQLQTVSNFAC